MDFSEKFESMRPYNDAEVSEALGRVTAQPEFREIIKYLYPEDDTDEVVERFRNMKTVYDFQINFSGHAVRQIAKYTSDGMSCSGIENIDPSQSYLFIANHRDIVLDSAIMQVMLVDNGHRTSQITFGSNLMSSEMIVDIGKLNKMFTFYRGGSKLQVYKNALLHSAYIHHVLTEKKESLWIAQRDGRTKDGDDRTEPAILKMFVAGRKDVARALEELNIVPVSISYEYEPCDVEKVTEKYVSLKEVYSKKPGEDLQSVLAGIKGYKGRIHMAFGKPLNQTLKELEENIEDITPSELIDMLVDEIDYQLHKDYALWEGNYVAWDMMKNKTDYLGKKYEPADKDRFLAYISKRLEHATESKDTLEKLLVRMYAMPVVNYRKSKLAEKESE